MRLLRGRVSEPDSAGAVLSRRQERRCAPRKRAFKSDRARARFEFREKRLALKKQQDQERRRQKREALQKKRGARARVNADPVQAALERVKARKQALHRGTT